MAQCNICGKRTWFFLYHKCQSRLTVVNSRSPSISASVKSTPSDDLNFQFQEQQLLQQTTLSVLSGSDDSCRSAPTEPSYSHHESSNSTSHCHDSSSSYSSDYSSSSSDSSSSSSSWD